MDWLSRIRARSRLGRSVSVWQHPNYAPACLNPYAAVLGFQPDRAQRIVSALEREGILRRGACQLSPSASYQDLALVHDATYLDESQRASTLGSIYGIEPEAVDPESILLSQRLQVGGTIAAARQVMYRRGERAVAFHLGGGLHHAARSRGAGFCVYNDVAVAIARIRADGFRERVAIVDLDYHGGDGNLAVFADDENVLKYSAHGVLWDHLGELSQAKSSHSESFPPGTHDGHYLERVGATLEPALRAFRPRLVFYLAGNDVLRGDRMGDFMLSTDGVRRRDQMVTDLVRSLDTPLVVTLAGGYSPLAWRCSASYLAWLLTDHWPEPSSWEKEPTRSSGSRDEAAVWSMDELLEELQLPRSRTRVLGTMGPEEIELSLERHGVLPGLRDSGFVSLRVSLDSDRPGEPALRVLGARGGSDEHLLLELVVRTSLIPAGVAVDPWRMVDVDWLLLQDPTAAFSPEKPKLPGQVHPGLGVALSVQGMLKDWCARLGLDGILSRPAHYHNAVVASRDFRFLAPEREGRFLAIRRCLGGLPLLEAATALEERRLVASDGSAITWESSDQALAVSPRLKRFLESPEYRERALLETERLLSCAPRLIAAAR